MRQVEEVRKKNKLLAMIVRNDYSCDGVNFITSNEYSQQVAYMHHSTGKIIDAHIHNMVHRTVVLTQEVLFIKRVSCELIFMMSMKTIWRVGTYMSEILFY